MFSYSVKKNNTYSIRLRKKVIFILCLFALVMRQTLQTQIRRHITRFLIIVNPVFAHPEVLDKQKGSNMSFFFKL